MLSLSSLLADSRTMRDMQPRPRTLADLQPTIDLLTFYGVLSGSGTTLAVRLDPSTGDVDATKLDHAARSISRVTEDFDSRAAAKDPIHPIGQTGLIGIADAAGAAVEKKADRDAERAVEDLKAQLAEHVVVRAPGPDGKPRRPITPHRRHAPAAGPGRSRSRCRTTAGCRLDEARRGAGGGHCSHRERRLRAPSVASIPVKAERAPDVAVAAASADLTKAAGQGAFERYKADLKSTLDARRRSAPPVAVRHSSRG
jgi:hypothetical protein